MLNTSIVLLTHRLNAREIRSKIFLKAIKVVNIMTAFMAFILSIV